MNGYLVFTYFACFAVIAGAAFAMMWANVRSISQDMNEPLPYKRHPEAPEPGDEVMYADFSRERLERLFEDG